MFMKGIRKQYPNLLMKLEGELFKEQCTEELGNLDMNFMKEVLKIRPSLLSNPEIDTRIEIIALRLGKVFKKIVRPTCQ